MSFILGLVLFIVLGVLDRRLPWPKAERPGERS